MCQVKCIDLFEWKDCFDQSALRVQWHHSNIIVLKQVRAKRNPNFHAQSRFVLFYTAANVGIVSFGCKFLNLKVANVT